MADLKIFTDNIEQKAREQIDTLLEQPAFADCKVRIMPDVHAGAGCVIGFTANLGDKVIPNIVGVDIGCGMLVVFLGQATVNFEKLDAAIRGLIPAGMNVHESEDSEHLREQSRAFINMLHCKSQLRNVEWLERSLCTLGGGNHFIEIDEDNNGGRYLIIHTGSRNLGKQVAEIYQQRAIDRFYSTKDARKALIEQLKAEGREKDISAALKELKPDAKIPKDLCYLEGSDRDDYLHDMKVCQEFARVNRELISIRILHAMCWQPHTFFHTVHNYIDDENMVRKGAISAKKGEPLLIPLNMRDGCILGRGKGNPDWNYSAPHGAGRIMSRRQARESVSLEDFKESMDGIYTTTVDESTLDESPMVYKPADEIVGNIQNTVEIINILKPVYNFKASE